MPAPLTADIPTHLAAVRRRLEAAAQRAGRRASDILLVAVSKTFSAEHVQAAAAAGQRDFGENRVQEGLDKIDALKDAGLTWHLIGTLQTNKARKAAAHSAGSIRSIGWSCCENSTTSRGSLESGRRCSCR